MLFISNISSILRPIRRVDLGCPDMEVSMGVPRESVRLVGVLDDTKLVAERSGRDCTEAMQQCAAVQTRGPVEQSHSAREFYRADLRLSALAENHGMSKFAGA